jgi:hypothetical protein
MKWNWSLQVKKACATRTRLQLEWQDATNAYGRIAASLVDNSDGLSEEQHQNLYKNLDLVRDLSEKLKKDLDLHMHKHRCAIDHYQEIVKLLDHLASKHSDLAKLFEGSPDLKYLEGDKALAQAERLAAEACARLITSMRSRLPKRG